MPRGDVPRSSATAHTLIATDATAMIVAATQSATVGTPLRFVARSQPVRTR
jgi:hypothetical protein